MHIKKTDIGSDNTRLWLVIGSFTFRLNRVIFSGIMLIASFFLLWPGYMVFSSATPFILGLPFSFVWVVLWVLIGFFAMLGLYKSDNKNRETD